MVSLDELDTLRFARELIQAELRLTIVRGLTRIGTRTLRQWWRDIHGVKASNGKLPESVLSFIRDKDAAARLSAFAVLNRRLHGQTLTPESLLSSWREFRRHCAPLDINAAYFAARDVRASIVMLSRCRKCNAVFIYDAGSKHTIRCPFCETEAL